MSDDHNSDLDPLSSSDRSRSSSPEDPELALFAEIEKQLRIHARRDLDQRKHFTVGSEHDKILCRAISKILVIDLALETYAQILDGLPLGEVASDHRPSYIRHDHPVHGHAHICPKAIDKTLKFRDEFDSHTLTFHPALLQEFRSSTIRSQVFDVRLIELVSYAVHQVGVYLSQLQLGLHEGGVQDTERVRQWAPPGENETRARRRQPPFEPPLTLFFHPGFTDVRLFPNAVHDMVGYWAENRILGGVPAFNRMEERRHPFSPPNVYMNCSRSGATNRIYQLHDSQQQALIDFLISEPATVDSKAEPSQTESPTKLARDVPCPLPLLPDRTNRIRVDVFNAISDHFIFRDVWERMPPTRQDRIYYGRRPMGEMDYPENRELMEAINNLPSSSAEINVSRFDEGVFPQVNEPNQAQALSGSSGQAKSSASVTCDIKKFRRNFWDAIYNSGESENWAERMIRLEAEQALAAQDEADKDRPSDRSKPSEPGDKESAEPARKRLKRESSGTVHEKSKGRVDSPAP